jgi:hypothetical protein
VIKTGIITAILCLILVLTGGFGVRNASTQESVWVQVGNIPDNWYKSVEEPLGSYEGEFGDAGLIEYIDDEDYDVVQIYYERAPDTIFEPLDVLACYILERDLGIIADEYGTMTIAGTTAGYAKTYDYDWDVYDMEIVMVKGIVFIDIYACYDATSEDEAQVRAIIDSIEAPSSPTPTSPTPTPTSSTPTPTSSTPPSSTPPSSTPTSSTPPSSTTQPTTTAISEEKQHALEMVGKTETYFLAAVKDHYDSIYNTAVRSKIGTGFMIGQMMEKYDVNLEDLKENLSSGLYEKLDYAYDLEKVDSLREYCRENRYDEFSEKYMEHAEYKVEEEFAFSEAERRLIKGFEELRDSIENGEMDSCLNMLAGLLDECIKGIDQLRMVHAESMVKSQEAALTVTEVTEVIDKLTWIADKLFDGKLDKVKMASALSLVWAQNMVRFWTTRAYLWGGTDLLKDTELERLREQYNLFEREEFFYGPVYIVEDGIEEILEPWQ